MIICLEGVDATGKSTLADRMSKVLGLPIQQGDGPPKYPGEMHARLTRFKALYQEEFIFDRHPVVSQTIYREMDRVNQPTIPQYFIDQFYQSRPLFIYCDPGNNVLRKHRETSASDTPEFLARLKKYYPKILALYREWAVHHAFLCYRIGDDMNRVINAVRVAT